MLLNEHNLNIAKLASKEHRFSINTILVTPKETVATDGRCMMIVSNVDMDAADFPIPLDGPLKVVDDWKPFSVSAQNALDAAKALPKKTSILSVLTCAAVCSNSDGTMHVVTNDLEKQTDFRAAEGAMFPDYERVIPKEENQKFKICLDAQKLKPILEQFIAFSAKSRSRKFVPPAYVTFSFEAADKAVTMTAKNQVSGQTMKAVLMPCRL